MVLEKEVKICSKCGLPKPLNKFYSDRGEQDGLKRQCKLCVCEVLRKNYARPNSHYKEYCHIKAANLLPEKKQQYNIAVKKAHPEMIRANKRQWRRNNPDKVRNQRFKRQFGITIEQYNKLFQNQDGRCAICGRHQTELKRRLAIDHNHKTGKIRALLCTRCNLLVGRVETDLINLVLAYVKIHNE